MTQFCFSCLIETKRLEGLIGMKKNQKPKRGLSINTSPLIMFSVIHQLSLTVYLILSTSSATENKNQDLSGNRKHDISFISKLDAVSVRQKTSQKSIETINDDIHINSK